MVSELYGSLGATGKGHGSDKAVLLGLEGEEPHSVDIEGIDTRLGEIRAQQEVRLLGVQPVRFVEKQHLQFKRTSLPYHPNGMRLYALDEGEREVYARTYYSVGGGFVVDEDAAGAPEGANACPMSVTSARLR